MVNIWDAVCGVICPWSNNKDGISWQQSSSSSVESLWDHIREKQARVDWYKLVWGSLHIPRHSFIAWLALLNRLATKTRQLRTGRSISNVCNMCHQSPENRDQLFFTCAAIKEVWRNIFLVCGIWQACWRLGYWTWLHKEKSAKRGFAATVLRLAQCSYIYVTRQETNRRIHAEKSSTDHSIN